MNNDNLEILRGKEIMVFYIKKKENLNKKINEKINDIWNNFLMKKKVYNGSLLNFVELKNEKEKITLYGEFIDYKTFIAHRQDPELGLNIKIISVSGITIINEENKEYVVFAKRKNTTRYENYFETIPSGDIEKGRELPNKQIDYELQLIKEFEEETNLSKKEISSIEFLGVIFDKKEENYDICCILNTRSTREEVKNAIKDSKEYESPIFVEDNKIERFIEENYSLIVPTSIGITKLYIDKPYILKIQKTKENE